MIEVFDRAFRRARLPISFSEGFNPRPKLSFAHPLAVGISSNGEIGEVELTERLEAEDFINRLNTALPIPIRILNAEYTDEKKSLMSLVKAADYTIQIDEEFVSADDVENMLNKSSIEIEKTSKSGKTNIVDIKPLIIGWEWIRKENKEFRVELATGSNDNLRPDTIVKLFGEVEKYKIIREKIYIN